MNCPEYTEQVFISQFPEFTEAENIELYINRALLYISPYCAFCGERKQYVVFLLAAHLLAIQDNVNNGENTGGLQTGASIDKVSVSVAPPPFTDGFEYWLNQTAYGQQLLAFFNMMASVPTFHWGSFQRVLQ